MNFRPYTSRRRSERNMSGRASLNVAIAAAILFAGAAFLWLHFRGGSEQPVVSFTPIAHATEPIEESPVEHSGTAAAVQPPATSAKKPTPAAASAPLPGEELQFAATTANGGNVCSHAC